MAAPVFRAAGLGPAGTTASTTIPKPSGTVEGDVLYALVVNGGATSAPPTVPSGWVLTEGLTMATGWAGVYEHVAGAAEPADYTWSGFVDSCAGTMVAVSGADTTTPTHQASATYNFDDSAPSGAGVTTTAADCLIVGGVGIGDNTGITDASWACATDPTSLTERAEVPSTGGNDTTSALATGPQTAAGPTGDLSVALAGSRNSVVFVVAVQPPAAGGGTVTGAASAAFGGTASATGRRSVAGAGAAQVAVSASAAGTRTVHGAASSPGGFTASAAGRSAASGSASAVLGFTAAGSGVRTVHGSASLPLGFTAAAAGAGGAGGATGSASAVLGGSAVAVGLRTVHGAASAAGGFAAAAAGHRNVYGSATATLGGTTSAVSGQLRARGAATAAVPEMSSATAGAPSTSTATAGVSAVPTATGGTT